jgi:cobalamin biosynthesis protein CobT
MHALGIAIIFSAQGRDTSYFPAPTQSLLAQFADIVKEANTTETALDIKMLAEKAADRMKELADPEPSEGEGKEGEESEGGEGKEEGEEGEGKEGEESEGGEGSEGEEGEGEGEGKEEGEEGEGKEGEEGEGGGEGKEEGEGEGKEEGEGEGEGEGGGEGKEEGEVKASDVCVGDISAEGTMEAKKIMAEDKEMAPVDFLEKEISEMAEDEAHKMKRHLATPEALAADKEITLPTGNWEWIGKSVSSLASALKSKLVSVLLAQKAAYTQGDQINGRLDPRTLWSVRLGNKRVFSQLRKGETKDVAVQLLIDKSGSMNGSRIAQAKQATAALGEALNAIGVSFAAMAFHNLRDRLPRALPPYNRALPFCFEVIKDFHEKWQQVRGRLQNLSHGEENCDGEALRFAAKKLAQQKAERHVLIVLSDGQPCCPAYSHLLMVEDLREAIKEISAAGIEVVGIGIETAYVKGFYPDHVHIKKADELPVGLMKVLQRKLMGRRKGKA